MSTKLKFELKPFQTVLLSQLISLLEEKKKVILAATTGTGKTEILIEFIKKHPNKRILILAHGQRTIRENFADRLQLRGIEHYEVQASEQVKESNEYDVVVALPQNIYKVLKLIDQFDYLIVDEAHQYYSELKRMYGKILRWHKGKEILATATHYDLKGHKIFFSRQQAMEVGMLSDAEFNVWGVDKTGIKQDSFAGSGELLEEINITKSSYDKIYSLLDKKKTMIVCHNTEFASKLYKKLLKDKKSVGLSDCYTDADSVELKRFKDGKLQILIVVMRGNIGFDYPDLECVIDASYSKNPKRIEQLLGRVSRKSNKFPLKTYHKLIPMDMFPEYLIYTTSVMGLGVQEEYEKFDGKMGNMVIKLPTDGLMKTKAIIDNIYITKFKVSGHYKTTFGQYVSLWEQKDGVHTTTISKALNAISNGRDPDGNKQILLDMLRRGEPRPNGKSKNPEERKLAYSLTGYVTIGQMLDIDFKNKLNELDMKVFPDSLGWTGWNEEKVKNSAKKFKIRSKWQRAHGSAYVWAQRKKVLDKCCAHMEVLKKTHTLESCMKSAKKFKTRSEWKENDSGAVAWARINEATDECCAHMADSKNKVKAIICNETKKVYTGQSGAAKDGYSSNMSYHLSGKRKTVNGHTFRYATEKEVALAKKQGRFVE